MNLWQDHKLKLIGVPVGAAGGYAFAPPSQRGLYMIGGALVGLAVGWTGDKNRRLLNEVQATIDAGEDIVDSARPTW